MKTKVIFLAFVAIVNCSSASPVKKRSSESPGIEKNTLALNGDISFLRSHRQGKGTSVDWGVTSSEGIAGFIVQRTYEDPTDPYAFWENISSMSCNSSRSYKCDDENVFPGFISYRVVIVMSNGSKTTSNISTVHIVSRHG